MSWPDCNVPSSLPFRYTVPLLASSFPLLPSAGSCLWSSRSYLTLCLLLACLWCSRLHYRTVVCAISDVRLLSLRYVSRYFLLSYQVHCLHSLSEKVSLYRGPGVLLQSFSLCQSGYLNESVSYIPLISLAITISLSPNITGVLPLLLCRFPHFLSVIVIYFINSYLFIFVCSFGFTFDPFQ